MPISAVSLPLSFKSMNRNLRTSNFPEIEPSVKYLVGKDNEDEPTSLKTSRGLDLLA